MFFVVFQTFSKLAFSPKKSGVSSVCQTVWIQIRTDILSVLIWAKTVSKDYQQKAVASKELTNSFVRYRKPSKCALKGAYVHYHGE